MRPLGGVLGSSWGLLAALGALLGALGASWGRLGRVLGPLEKACEKDVENIFKKEPKEKSASLRSDATRAPLPLLRLLPL